MSDHQNDEIDYIFSTHRKLMEIVGLWPLCQQKKSTIAQWSLMTVLQLSSLAFVFMEFNGNQYNADSNLEGVIYLTTITASVMKNFCIIINRTKLAKNINSIINDWRIMKIDKESYQIMKKYAFKSRLFTAVMMYTCYMYIIIYPMSIIMINLKQAFLQNTDISNADNKNTTNRVFLIPSGELGDKITSPLYAVFTVLQVLQINAISVTQSTSDSFYINIILHLAGQLEVLKAKFKTFANKSDTEVNNRKRFIDLIDRHCELMDFVQNLEDTFHLIILYQLIMVTLLLALLGLRMIFCLHDNNYVLLVKNLICLIFLLGESVVYTYGGDFIQRGSEDIIYAMFMTSWFTLPSAMIKDLYFAMMKSSYPFRLTGGKFFYANRETMLNVFKTALSYISVLRVALKN